MLSQETGKWMRHKAPSGLKEHIVPSYRKLTILCARGRSLTCGWCSDGREEDDSGCVSACNWDDSF
jgi:hypothetical protein